MAKERMIKAKATATGQVNGVMVRAGDTFEVAESAYSKRWMTEVPAPAKAAPKVAKETGDTSI